MVDDALEQKIAELVALHRPVLERLAASNGTPAPKPDAVRVRLAAEPCSNPRRRRSVIHADEEPIRLGPTL